MALVSISADPGLTQLLGAMLLYVGPDLLLPVTSALAALAGVLLMFWHRVTGFVRKMWNQVFQRKD